MKLLRRTVAGAAVMLIVSNAQAQNLFVSDVGSGNGSGNIYEYMPGGVQSTFASGGLDEPLSLTFQPTPEPSTLGLMVVGATALLVRRRKLVALLISDSSGN